MINHPLQAQNEDRFSLRQNEDRFSWRQIVGGASLFLGVLYFVFMSFRLFETRGFQGLSEKIQIGNTLFMGTMMSTIPFLLLGILVSAWLRYFVSNRFLVRVFPKQTGIGFVSAVFAGLLLPVCECGIVPVATRLIRKGVTVPVAITFMLAAPIVNPIVILSTWMAFQDYPKMVFIRLFLGICVALIVGFSISFIPKLRNVTIKPESLDDCCAIPMGSMANEETSFLKRLQKMLLFTGEEFFKVGKFVLLGAFLASLMQIVLPRTFEEALWNKPVVSILGLMAFAFAISICSSADAFIARGLMNRLPFVSVVGFLIYGPVMDLKSVMMLFEHFPKRFVVTLFAMITIVTFSIVYFVGMRIPV